MSLAIFDLDNTLLNGDSDHAWGEFLVQQGIVDGNTYKQANDHFYQQYQQGHLDIFEYLEFALKPLAAHSKQQLDVWHAEFMQKMILPMFQPKADALLQQHREAGDYLLIITATNRFVTEPIAHALGVDAILATEPEFINGAFTGKVAGTPCFREGKVTRLQQWLKETGITLKQSYFYSDSHNDLPLLQMVENPVAVDADDELSRYAKAAGWPMISLHG